MFEFHIDFFVVDCCLCSVYNVGVVANATYVNANASAAVKMITRADRQTDSALAFCIQILIVNTVACVLRLHTRALSCQCMYVAMCGACAFMSECI